MDKHIEELSKPVAEVNSKYGDPEAFGERELKVLADIQKMPYRTKFYSQEYVDSLLAKLEAAQQELIKPLPIGELVHRLEGQTYEKWFSESDVKDLRERAETAEAALSAANEKLKGDQVPVAANNGVTAENLRVIKMLLDVCGTAFELADDSCQQDVDGELCHVVPDSTFSRLSDALDEIENTLPDEYEYLPNIVLQWAAIPRHALQELFTAAPKPAGFTVEGEHESVKYIVILQSAWCNDSGSGISYDSDLVQFDKRDTAITWGFRLRDSDDFNIGVLTNGALTSFDWMAKPLAATAAALAQIAENIGVAGFKVEGE
ncbi:hypothetical protein [Yersinia frederiksenii]|uniref:hypothetical protein n=1 Tax=Yersinia frederiksenii TaxID=29484 RepID=UPI001D05BA3D|nr:hypothetical protein [Yersinia frederiksenii]